MSGPDTALVVRDVPRHDLRAGLATALGSRVGLIVWGLAAALGIFGLVTLSEC
jgi:threonine/homoserine/homoserine lactone efflux protein